MATNSTPSKVKIDPTQETAAALAAAVALLAQHGVSVKLPEAPRSLIGQSVTLSGGNLSQGGEGKNYVYRLRGKHFGGQLWISPEVKDLSGYNGEIVITFQ